MIPNDRIGNSLHKNLKNSSVRWISPDSMENWIENNKDPLKRKILADLEWDENSISYVFNSHGFRSDEFDGDGAMFLGCSFTFGVGMNWERTWAYRVAKQLNLRCWNLGIGGGSNDTAFRLGSYWIPKLQPKHVFYLRTQPARFELLTEVNQLQFLPNSSPDKKYQPFADQWMGCDLNTMLNEQKNLLALQQICATHNIPLYTASIMDKYWSFVDTDCARDIIHLGPKWNEVTANHFIRMMKA